MAKPTKKHFTFDELSPEVQARVIERQATCPHPLWTQPVTWLVNAAGNFGSSGERGDALVQCCVECGVHKGVYRASFWGKGDVEFLLKQGESLMSKGYLKLWLVSRPSPSPATTPPRPPSCR